MRLRRPTFTLSVLLLGGCYGGQSGDPGVNQSPVTPDIIVPPVAETDCQRNTWSPDEPQPSTHSCKLADESASVGERPVEWSCDCAGTRRTSDAARCDDALLDACGIKYKAATYCSYPLGVCFPNDEAGDDWLCRCGESATEPGMEVDNVVATDCASALLETCGLTCEARVGSCDSSLDASQMMTCACANPFAESGEATASTPVLANLQGTCDATLAETCGGTCESETGACVIDEGGYMCTCSDESSSHIAATDLSLSALQQGIYLCGEALGQACGLIEAGQSCSSSTANWSATCAPRPYVAFPQQDAPSTYTFDCDCSVTAPIDGGTPSDGGGRTGGEESTSITVDAPHCEAAITAACPGAIRPGTDPNGPTLDYGHPCTEAEECSGEACYVPGTKVNPICSKHCETDGECPDFARCISGAGGYPGGHCFVRCEEDDECRELNPAITLNPLHCVTDYDVDAPGVCVQASEP